MPKTPEPGPGVFLPTTRRLYDWGDTETVEVSTSGMHAVQDALERRADETRQDLEAMRALRERAERAEARALKAEAALARLMENQNRSARRRARRRTSMSDA